MAFGSSWCADVWVFFATCFRHHLLYPLDEALLPLVHSQSSGLLFMEKTLTFSSKSSYRAQVLFPLAAQISLSLMLANSNKILPQYFVLNCSQPDFFHFISLCVQKDRVSNRVFITLSPQTYSLCFFCIRDFIGVFFQVFYFSCFVSAVMTCSKVLLLSR